MKEFQPTSWCIKCNGECCRRYSGVLSPDDIDQSKGLSSGIKALLLSGNYAIDWWEGTEELNTTYFIRPAHTNAKGKLRDPSWGGICVFYEDGKGCSLPFSKRPAQCRALEPKENKKCISHLVKIDAAKLWIPYQHEIIAMIEEIGN